MTYHMEFKSADNVETKDGSAAEFETRFEEYHSATKAALDAAEKRADEMEARMNLMNLSGALDSKSVDARKVEQERKAFGRFIKSGDESEFKSLSVGNDVEGGYLTASTLSTTINQKTWDQSPIRRLARVITVPNGTSWEEPVDFNDVGASWVHETGARTETDNPDLGMLSIPLNEIYAHQTVTQKLLDLSYVDIGSWIEGKIADKFGRTQGIAYVNGNGVGRPKGFMQYSTSADIDGVRPLWTIQHKVSGAAATIADADGQANGLIDLFWSLRAPYRNNATWLMSSATANSLDRLKDANKNYIWRMGMTAGSPPELLGRPVEFDENMPSEGAGNFPIAFGDFSRAYTIVEWSQIRPIRDPYSDKPNVVFYAYRRVGGGLSNSEAVKLLKCSTS